MSHVNLNEIKAGQKGTVSSGDMVLDNIREVLRLEIFNLLPPPRPGNLQKLHNLKADLDVPICLSDGFDQLG